MSLSRRKSEIFRMTSASRSNHDRDRAGAFKAISVVASAVIVASDRAEAF
jgi:hypothetical protein